MEDILEVYALPYDPEIPMVCMDEQPYQLLGESRESVPMKPGQPAKQDYEYTREGTCSIFMFTEPLNGTRHVHASTRRTKQDWARRIQELLDKVYPDAKKVRLVMDNLNTHTISSLYETFPPKVARNLARRLEIHLTP
ncbi:MAG TPA: transposase, partial [Clostridia bacterium]|nr:transposase [Clostridia bacterium]